MKFEKESVNGLTNCVECMYNDYHEDIDKIYCLKSKKEIPMFYSEKLKMKCVDGIPDWCELNDNQSGKDDVRTAFKESIQYKNAHSSGQAEDRYVIFKSGYKSAQEKAQQKAQAEIEEVRDTYLEMGTRIKDIEDMLQEETDNTDKIASQLFDSESELKEHISTIDEMIKDQDYCADKLNAAEKKIESIMELAGVQELNMYNYTDDQVDAINNAITDIYNICSNWKQK